MFFKREFFYRGFLVVQNYYYSYKVYVTGKRYTKESYTKDFSNLCDARDFVDALRSGNLNPVTETSRPVSAWTMPRR